MKKRQLMELAIINGTYRDTTRPPPSPSQSALAGRKCCLDFCSHPHSCVSVMIWLPPFCAACLAAAHTWLFSLLLVAQFFPSYHGCARGWSPMLLLHARVLLIDTPSCRHVQIVHSMLAADIFSCIRIVEAVLVAYIFSEVSVAYSICSEVQIVVNVN